MSEHPATALAGCFAVCAIRIASPLRLMVRCGYDRAMSRVISRAEAEQSIEDLRDRARTVTGIAAMTGIDAMEWKGNPGQVTGVELDEDVLGKSCNDALTDVVHALKRLAESQERYAQLLRRRADQFEKTLRNGGRS